MRQPVPVRSLWEKGRPLPILDPEEEQLTQMPLEGHEIW
jgi:hypothetical protein